MSSFCRPFVLQALGLLALFNLAVAHPVFEVLAASPEFFAARRAGAGDVWLFAAVLSLALPAAIVGLIAMVRRLSLAAGDVAQAAAVGVLVAALALQLVEQFGVERAIPAFALAALAGAAVAGGYGRLAAMRSYIALLAPAILVVPGFFLGRPAIRTFTAIRTGPPVEYPTAPLQATPPIVLVVFDQLPLVSLLDAEGRIDPTLYPAFAALAAEATWFRNATAVAPVTGWALPSTLTGLLPRESAPPIAAAYPNNLFTFLARTYRMHVVEPITGLCPASLCPPLRDPVLTRLAAMAIDAALVYLHVAAPRELEADLPPVNQNWKNFTADRGWQQRWIRQRDADRRDAPERFIDGIGDGGARPTLYFLHALLPHEPYIYGRTGQVISFSPALPGLTRSGRWDTDDWLVAQDYQAHLVQVGYVDTLLGRIVARLKTEGLYDDALIVVTSDHGASFQPGLPFKGLNAATAADIMAVPLLVKTPGQQTAVISDRNVETVDIVPTIADLLGAALPWKTYGAPAFDGAARPRSDKVVFVGGEQPFVREARVLPDAVRAAVARKLRVFHGGDPYAPVSVGYRELVGRELGGLAIGEAWDGTVLLDEAVAFSSVDTSSDFIPARLMGQAYDDSEASGRVALAIAVNGRVCAVTMTAEGRPGWSAFVPAASLRPGRNDVRIFVIDQGADGPVLRPAFETRRPLTLDLVSGPARHTWGVRQSGLHPREFRGTQPFYWTDGAARLVTPLEAEARPTALQIDIAMTAPGGTDLQVLADGCELFSGRISGRWSQTFRFDRCRLDGDEATIEVLSGTFVPRGGDTRTLGVALERIVLVSGS